MGLNGERESPGARCRAVAGSTVIPSDGGSFSPEFTSYGSMQDEWGVPMVLSARGLFDLTAAVEQDLAR